jgi:hypothetical protein
VLSAGYCVKCKACQAFARAAFELSIRHGDAAQRGLPGAAEGLRVQFGKLLFFLQKTQISRTG